MYFQGYGFREKLLDKCMKSRLSEETSTSHIVNAIK